MHISDRVQNTSEVSKNPYKTVGEIVPTRYPLSIHIDIDNTKK